MQGGQKVSDPQQPIPQPDPIPQPAPEPSPEPAPPAPQSDSNINDPAVHCCYNQTARLGSGQLNSAAWRPRPSIEFFRFLMLQPNLTSACVYHSICQRCTCHGGSSSPRAKLPLSTRWQ